MYSVAVMLPRSDDDVAEFFRAAVLSEIMDESALTAAQHVVSKECEISAKGLNDDWVPSMVIRCGAFGLGGWRDDYWRRWSYCHLKHDGHALLRSLMQNNQCPKHAKQNAHYNGKAQMAMTMP